MNVLMMVSWYSAKGEIFDGGIFHYEYARELQKYCNVAIYYPYDRTIDDYIEENEEWGIKTYRSKYKLENKIRNRIYMLKSMRKIVKDFSPDIIHANVATEAGRFGVALGKIFKIPVIVTEHSAVENSGVTEFPHKLYAKFAYKYSYANICVSNDLTNKLKNLFPKFEFQTIYNGINIPQIEVRPNNRYRIDECVNIIMIAGMYDRYIKGFDNVFLSLKNLINEGYSVFLHILGDGEYRAIFEKIVHEYKICSHCKFYGNLTKTEVYSVLSEMDYLVSASTNESFGCAVAEAALMGIPIVATKSGGPESIVTKENGILVEKSNIDALFNGIKYMYQHFRDYDSKKISNDAKMKFGMDQIVSQYLVLYKKILD